MILFFSPKIFFPLFLLLFLFFSFIITSLSVSVDGLSPLITLLNFFFACLQTPLTERKVPAEGGGNGFGLEMALKMGKKM